MIILHFIQRGSKKENEGKTELRGSENCEIRCTLRRSSLRPSRCVLIILSAPEDARDVRAEEEARTSRVRHLTPLIRQRSSGTRKSRTGSMTSPRPTDRPSGTWSGRAGQRMMMMMTAAGGQTRRLSLAPRRKIETHS